MIRLLEDKRSSFVFETDPLPPAMREAALRTRIKAQADAWKRIGAIAPRLIPETLLSIGTYCVAQALPGRYMRRPPQACYANAAALVRRARGLTYVEGMAKSATTGMVVDHAWCIDAERRVIDPTWDQPEDAAYLGVPIDRATYEDLTLFDGSSSAFLDENHAIRIGFLLKLNPALAEIIDAPKAPSLETGLLGDKP